MKFLVTVTPRRLQVPPVAVMEAAKAWLDANLADHTMDFVHAFITGGGVSVFNAESADAMMIKLMNYPAYPFADFKVEALCDIHKALDQVIAMARRAAGQA